MTTDTYTIFKNKVMHAEMSFLFILFELLAILQFKNIESGHS